MQYDAGITYDASGNDAGGGGGPRFGGRWVCGGMAGLSLSGGSSGSTSSVPSQPPVYYRGPNRALPFGATPVSGEYKAMYYNAQQLTFETGSSDFKLLDPSGTIRTFDDSGRIRSVLGQCGNQMTYTYGPHDRLSGVTILFADGSNKYEYSWDGGGRVSQVLFKVNLRAVLKTVYGYDADGNLLTVKLYGNPSPVGTAPVWGEPISASRYSYHPGGGLVRHVVPPAQYRQMLNNGINPDSATEAELNEYASAEYFYNGQGRVSLMYKKGRRYGRHYEYWFRNPQGTDLNLWATRTTVAQPDGSQHVYYFNRIGQMILHKVAESASPSAKAWYPLYQRFDPGSGRIMQSAGHSAIASVSESNPELVTLKTDSGMITVYAYDGNNWRESVGIKMGSAGAVQPIRGWTYEARTVPGKGTVYLPSSQKTYRSAASSDFILTAFAYSDWYPDSFQFGKRTTTLPVISPEQNGRGRTLTTEDHHNSRGLLVRTVDERGSVTEFAYDEARGGMTSMTEDAGGLGLVSDYLLDDRGRRVRSLGPVHDIDLDGSPTAVRSAHWTCFKDAEASRWNFSGYQTAAGVPFDRIVGPVTIERPNIPPPPGGEYGGWRQSSTVMAEYSGTGIPPLDWTFDRPSWLAWSLSLYDLSSELRERRTYFEIPADGYGSRSVNYSRSLLGYDPAGRRNQTTDPSGTVDRTVFNAMDRAVREESGTTAGALVVIAANEYDDDGNPVKITLPVDSVRSNDRVATMDYDWRNRRIRQTVSVEKDGGGVWTLITKYDYDYRGQLVAVTGYHTSVADGNRTSFQTSSHDDLGRLYRGEVYGVDTSSGAVINPQVSNRYYNETGLVAREAPAGSLLFTATIYDALGRTKLVSRAYEPSPSGSSSSASSGTPPDPASLAGAIVISQREMEWDAAGNLLGSTDKQRFDDATGHGNLAGPDTEPKARVSYQALYPDPLGRTVAAADFGTNGGLEWHRPQTVPGPSDTVLVSTTIYDTVGNLVWRAAPSGVITLSTFDQAGRLTVTVENATGGDDNTRTTRYEYADDNGLIKLISQNPETGVQVTEWTRGVTTGQGSALNSNRLVYRKTHPDGSGGSDHVSYKYNRQSQATGMTDQAATFHAHTYDKLGRPLGDAVTFPSGTALDTTVGRLETGYNERGLVVRSTSLNPAGTVVINEVKSQYNAFNQLITEWQEHSGAVNPSTSLKVLYGYFDGSANTIRPAGITSPDGTIIATGYSTEMADALSRPDQVRDESVGPTELASMKFLGLGTLVDLRYAAASGARWTMRNGSTGDAGDPYTGLDRFGRLVETIWKTDSAELVHTKYGRNRVGGVVWQRNVKAHSLSVATRDNHYWYDGLRQVARHDRGDLMPASGPPYTGIDPATRRQMEVFTFDETGNRPGYFSQTPPLAQGRGHDRANQIISITGPAGVVQPAYDPAGNMTRMPRPGNWSAAADLTWDAWNRLVRIRDHSSSSSSMSSSSESSSSSSSPSSASSSSGDSSSSSSDSSPSVSSSSSLPSSPSDSSASWSSSDSSSSSGSSSSSSLASSGSYHSASSSSSGTVNGEIRYQYDARTRRTRKSNGAETRDYYYDSQWRAIEERVAGSVAAQYVWSPLDRWTMIRRKRGGEELYVLRDHLDPAAIIDTGGTVVERFGYDAFGPARFMDAAFATLPASNADWNFLFHAEFLDTDSGLYNYGYRYYHPELGRWLSRDPIQERGGLNLYGFVDNEPVGLVDILGWSPPKTAEEGLEKLKKLEAKLKALCKPCCACPMFNGDTKELEAMRVKTCEAEAKKIADKIIEEWKRHYDSRPDANHSESSCGTLLCYDWASIFDQCGKIYDPKAFDSIIQGGIGPDYVHFWATFAACGKADSSCKVEVDNGFLNGEMVHAGGVLPGKEGWRKYRRNEALQDYERLTKRCPPPKIRP